MNTNEPHIGEDPPVPEIPGEVAFTATGAERPTLLSENVYVHGVWKELAPTGPCVNVLSITDDYGGVSSMSRQDTCACGRVIFLESMLQILKEVQEGSQIVLYVQESVYTVIMLYREGVGETVPCSEPEASLWNALIGVIQERRVIVDCQDDSDYNPDALAREEVARELFIEVCEEARRRLLSRK